MQKDFSGDESEEERDVHDQSKRVRGKGQEGKDSKKMNRPENGV